MEICHNCKNKKADYNCDICKRSYCKQCDIYIHSFSSKKNHIRRRLFYSTAPIKEYESSKTNRYTTDENGFYVYTGNTNRNYSSLYKNNKNPLFENENRKYTSPPKTQKNPNFYENLSPSQDQKPKPIEINKYNQYFSPNLNKLPNENIKMTYNLDSNEEYNNYNLNNNKLSLSPGQLSASDSLNDTNHSFKRTKSFNSTKARNNLISFDEKIRLMKKISQLNCELSNARSDIDQKLDILHDHLHNYNEANKKELIELNYKNINEINIISSQKDTLIKHLKDVINDQEETIQKLLKKKQKIEDDINENKYLIEKYTAEKNNYIKEKETNEILYNEKKNMLEQRHESEMQKIRNDYDTEFERLSKKYKQTKSEYLNEIKKGNEIIEDFKLKGQKEIELLSSDVDNLQNVNNIKNKEQENIINNNRDLKKNLDDFHGKYDEINMKYKNSNYESERILKSFEDAQNLVKKRKKENTKLHDLKYGRF